MDSKENSSINFCGLTHDHNCDHVIERLAPDVKDATMQTSGNGSSGATDGYGNERCDVYSESVRSIIAILRRHTMYDCLILVKKYRSCLRSYSLEFPLDTVADGVEAPGEDLDQLIDSSAKTEASGASCGRRQMVSRVLDGDDPILQASVKQMSKGTSDTNVTHSDSTDAGNTTDKLKATAPRYELMNPFSLDQIGDDGQPCELVLVPVNGLLDRLENYTRSGIAVDSRVYAFAMGLKTSERILTSTSLKELQETPV